MTTPRRGESSLEAARTSDPAAALAFSNAGNVDLAAGAACLHDLLEAVALRTPEAPALVHKNRVVSYAELRTRAHGLARRLRALGVGLGAFVAIHLERSVDSVAGLWAASLVGAAYLPIDVEYSAARVAAIFERARPAVVLTRRATVDRLPGGDHALLLVDEREAPGEAPGGSVELPSPAAPDDAAYAIFTSGSTGVPKGVVINHRSLVNYLGAAAEAYGFVAGDRVLHAASIGFDLSIEEILVTLCTGGALVLRSEAMLDSVTAFLAECDRGGLTVVSITSVLWHELTARIADGSAELPRSLRLVILGADAARPDVLAEWQRVTSGRVRLINSYGLTETTVVATVWEASSEPLDASWKAVPIGRPLRNVSAYVLDGRLQPVPIGAVGEIYVGGLAVARGYLGDQALTRARFVDDPFVPGGRMYRTGDRGRLRPSGDLEFLGRDDHQVKIRGHRVELGEIEARLRRCPGVRDAVVVRVAEHDDELVAFLTHDGRGVDVSAVRLAVSASLPAYMLPSRIELLDAFPLTPAGKIDRRALAGAATRVRERRDSFIAPRSPLELEVARVIAESLHLPQVGLDDDFAALGCTSLAALRAASVLGTRLGVPVAARQLYETSTVRGLCAALARMAAGIAPAEEPEEALIERDARLDVAIAPAGGRRSVGRLPEAVLLTGATGFYGSFLLTALLEQTCAHAYCVVRATTPDQASTRLRTALSARHCDIDPKVLAERVTAVPGDLTEPWLGLREPLRARLLDTVDAIYHAAATVSYVLPYSALRNENTLAVERILRFAATGRPKSVHHVSTIGVVPSCAAAGGSLPDETFAATLPSDLVDGYARSKWAAERLVREAGMRGLDVTIYRPGRLMGHSCSGAFNPDDFLVQLLAVCAFAGAAPDLDADVDVTPVDFASGALVELSLASGGDGQVYHLLNPKPIGWRRLVASFAARGFPMDLLPFAEWSARVRAAAPSRDATSDFTLYLAGLDRRGVAELLTAGASCRRTAQALARRCPCVDDALIDTYAVELVRAAVLPSPGRTEERAFTSEPAVCIH